MLGAPTRYVSVSELYSTDEVELLLDEIRELEPTSCRGEDVQDFEIAGSGAGAGDGAGASGGGGGGGRSPVGTERSWDSHAHYSRAPPPAPRPLAPLYCRPRHCLTLPGLCQLLLVVCSAAVCGCVWGGVGVRLARLPLAARARLLLLGALSSLLVHGALLLMHCTRLLLLLPIHWERLGVWCCLWSCVSLWGGAALTLHALLAAPEYRWTPPPLARLLYAAAGLGGAGGLAALLVVAGAARAWWAERRALRAPPRSASASASASGSLRAAYRAVPSAPPPPRAPSAAPAPAPAPAAPQPSTSRDNPL